MLQLRTRRVRATPRTAQRLPCRIRVNGPIFPGAIRKAPMKYCNQCGDPVLVRVPDGDNRPRFVCDSCQTVHYQNPRIVAGCVHVWDDRVLLCRRAIQPRRGYWTLPAGLMETGENIQQAAAKREDDGV